MISITAIVLFSCKKDKIKNDKYIDFWEKYLIDNINFFKDNTLKVNTANLFQFKK